MQTLASEKIGQLEQQYANAIAQLKQQVSSFFFTQNARANVASHSHLRQLQQHASNAAALKTHGEALSAKLLETEGRLGSSVAEAAGMQMALSELQSAGANKDEAVGNALKALEQQWSKQALSLQQVCLSTPFMYLLRIHYAFYVFVSYTFLPNILNNLI